MTRLRSTGATSVFALFLSTTALCADVTPEQVWESWQKQYATFGFEVAPGSVAREGDTLAIRNLVFTSEVPVGEGLAAQTSTTTLTVPALLLKDQGDGTVKASVDGEIDGTNVVTSTTGAPETAQIRIDKSAATAVVSGTPEALSYLVDAPAVSVNVTATQAGGSGDAIPSALTIVLSGLAGTQQVTADTAGQQIHTDLKASGMTMHLEGANPEDGGPVKADMVLSNLTVLGDNMVPAGADNSDLGSALARGLRSDMKMGFGGATFTMDAAPKEGPVNISGTAQAGQMQISLAQEAFRYAVNGNGTTVSVKTAQLPMPVSAQIDRSEIDLAMPLAATATPQPMTARLVLDGLSVSEQIWAMFDPKGHLAHGPATLVIDLSGKMRTLLDLFSPEAAKSPVPPIELDSVDINKLQLTLAGADLSGQGALSFDNSAGTPKPIGAIDLQLSGANKLMDGLVAMGMMPQDQVMFAKMMMGVYAVPKGEDLLTSKIEFKDGGKIFANGQPIQ
ncbi:DUF2125 domain-containing protein [Rhodobacter maris]|uniref:Uncharacterized protein DUF2125 n=1 Tax=Rhodobacter maris TaxID=446682 RepID=A0A285SKS0_9RHOB|nr:DUF2125 domain-containing protein [Rhodobacter maris]SOC06578.1 uncharacterized protein DUF2125 [Rhodobacter maris]